MIGSYIMKLPIQSSKGKLKLERAIYFFSSLEKKLSLKLKQGIMFVDYELTDD